MMPSLHLTKKLSMVEILVSYKKIGIKFYPPHSLWVFFRSRRDRHAKTLDIAQEEVLTCLGIHIYERLHRIWQKLKAEEQTWQILFYLGVDALKKSFEVSVCLDMYCAITHFCSKKKHCLLNTRLDLRIYSNTSEKLCYIFVGILCIKMCTWLYWVCWLNF